MKVSDYAIDFLAGLGIEHVFAVCGGGNMHLVNSIGNNKELSYVATHHEQAAAMAAEAYSRLRGIGCALVTTGPGGTNAITGVACAWVDSIPLLILSGQVTQETMMEGGWNNGPRQLGVQETDIVTLVSSITKYATEVLEPSSIRFELEKAVYLARSGRPGPVWLDIPLDVQAAEVDPERLVGYAPEIDSFVPDDSDVELVVSMLGQAQRPVVIVGNGIRLAGGEAALRLLADSLQIPIVSSWTGADMMGDHACHIGHCGIFGDRASNFAVQNADLVLAVGCRLSLPQIGSKPEWFAREATLIMVDVDIAEIEKQTLRVDVGIIADAKWFLTALLQERIEYRDRGWMQKCLEWKQSYPVVSPDYAGEDKVNSYYFVRELSRHLGEDATVVLDMGTAFTGTYQAAEMKSGQRWITASGHAPMGYGLPGAIGAAFATGRKVICIVGDGALQMNLQELATIRHHNLPIVIFVLNNNGYLTMRHTQKWHFDGFVGINPESGLGFPDVMAIASAYDIPKHHCFVDNARIDADLGMVLQYDHPAIVELIMAEDQPQVPRERPMKVGDVSYPKPLEDMFPFLDRDEFRAQMLVSIV